MAGITVKLTGAETGKVYDIDGKHFADNYDDIVKNSPGAKVEMFDIDGKSTSVDVSKAKQMYGQGYTYQKDQHNPYASKVRAQRDREKNKPVAEQAKSMAASKSQVKSATPTAGISGEQDKLDAMINAGKAGKGNMTAKERDQFATTTDYTVSAPDNTKSVAGVIDRTLEKSKKFGDNINLMDVNGTRDRNKMYDNARQKMMDEGTNVRLNGAEEEMRQNDVIGDINKQGAVDAMSADIISIVEAESAKMRENNSLYQGAIIGGDYNTRRSKEANANESQESIMQRIHDSGTYDDMVTAAFFDVDKYGNRTVKDNIKRKANREGMSVNGYITRIGIPALQRKLEGDLLSRDLQKFMPKNAGEYIINGLKDSALGMLGSAALYTPSQRMAQAQADEEFVNKYGGFGEFVLRASNLGASMAGDMPLMVAGAGVGNLATRGASATAKGASWLLGKAGMKTAQKGAATVAANLMPTLEQFGVKELSAKGEDFLLANMSKWGWTGREFMRGAVSQSANMGSFMTGKGLEGALLNGQDVQWFAGEDSSAYGVLSELGKNMMFGVATTPASILGKIAPVMGKMGTNLAGTSARVGTKIGSKALEANTFVGLDYAFANDEERKEMSYTDSLMKNAAMVVGFGIAGKIYHGVSPKQLVGQYAELVRGKDLNGIKLTDAQMSNLKGMLGDTPFSDFSKILGMTDESVKQFYSDRDAYVSSMNALRNAGAGEKDAAKIDAANALAQMHSTLENVISNKEIPWTTRNKVSMALFGVGESSRPLYDYASIKGDEVVTYSADGEAIDVKKFTNADERASYLENERMFAKKSKASSAYLTMLARLKDASGEEYNKLAAEYSEVINGTLRELDEMYNNGTLKSTYSVKDGETNKRIAWENITDEKLKEVINGLLFAKDHTKYTEDEKRIVEAFERNFKNILYRENEGKVAPEANQEIGRDAAIDANLLGEQPKPEIGERIRQEYADAVRTVADFINSSDVVKDIVSKPEEVTLETMQKMIDSGVPSEQLRPCIDYINAVNRYIAFMDGIDKQINQSLDVHFSNIRNRNIEGDFASIFIDADGRRWYVRDADVNDDGTISSESGMVTLVDDAGMIDFRDAGTVKGVTTTDKESIIGDLRTFITEAIKREYEFDAKDTGTSTEQPVEPQAEGGEVLNTDGNTDENLPDSGNDGNFADDKPTVVLGKNGERLYTQSDPTATLEDFETRLKDRGRAEKAVARKVTDASKKVEDLQKKLDKEDDIDKQEALIQKLDEAQAELDYWNSVQALVDKRKSDEAEAEKARLQGLEENSYTMTLQAEQNASSVRTKEDWENLIREAEGRVAQAEMAGDTEKAAMERGTLRAFNEAYEEWKKLMSNNGQLYDNVPDASIDKASDARERGFRIANGVRIDRQEPISSVDGKEVDVIFSNEDTAKGVLSVVDAGSVQPSHLQGQRNMKFFITEAQPKDRTDNVSEAASDKMANELNTDLIGESPIAYTGAPIINSRGEVIQGNNRAVALKKMQGISEQKAKYKQWLIDNAEKFGLKAEDIEKMENPMLVRKLDVDDAEAIRLGQFDDMSITTGGNERIDAKKTLSKAKEEEIDWIMRNMFSTVDDVDMTIGQLIDKNGIAVLKYMRDHKLISDTQYQSAFKKNGEGLSDEGKNDIRKLMLHNILNGGVDNIEEMFNSLPHAAQAALVPAMAGDARLKKEDRLISSVQNAIVAASEIARKVEADKNLKIGSSDADFADLVRALSMQMDAFDTSKPLNQRYSALELKIAHILLTNKQKAIKQMFKEYQDAVSGTKQASLFGESEKLTRAEAIYRLFNIKEEGNDRETEIRTIIDGRGKGKVPERRAGEGFEEYVGRLKDEDVNEDTASRAYFFDLLGEEKYRELDKLFADAEPITKDNAAELAEKVTALLGSKDAKELVAVGGDILRTFGDGKSSTTAILPFLDKMVEIGDKGGRGKFLKEELETFKSKDVFEDNKKEVEKIVEHYTGNSNDQKLLDEIKEECDRIKRVRSKGKETRTRLFIGLDTLIDRYEENISKSEKKAENKSLSAEEQKTANREVAKWRSCKLLAERERANRSDRLNEVKRKFGVVPGKKLDDKDVCRLFYALTDNKETIEIFQKVQPIVEKLGLQYSAIIDKNGVSGDSSTGGKIRYDIDDMLHSCRDNEDAAATILHEKIHQVEMYLEYYFDGKAEKLLNNPRCSKELKDKLQHYIDSITPEQKEAWKEIEQIYNACLENTELFKGNFKVKGKMRSYAMTDIGEFIAEFSKPEHREDLKKCGLWEKCVKGLMKLFGIEPKNGKYAGTAYDRMYKAFDELLNSFDETTWENRKALSSKSEDSRRSIEDFIDAGENEQIDSIDTEIKFKRLDSENPEDVEELKHLNALKNDELVPVYRSMQIVNIDGKRYIVPPMSGKVEGKWQDPIEIDDDGNIVSPSWYKSDERPWLAHFTVPTATGKSTTHVPIDKCRQNENGEWEYKSLKTGEWEKVPNQQPVFYLDKTGKGKDAIWAAYNPYGHYATGMLNDQFSSAQDRDNLVSVKFLIPKSELKGEYKAKYAKDTTGEIPDWKAGVITSQLTGTRGVILSRWGKPVSIVPNSEVADNIYDTVTGSNIVFPSNVVPKEVRKLLEDKGIKFVETDNQGRLKEGKHKGDYYSMWYSLKPSADNIKKWTKKTGMSWADMEQERNAMRADILGEGAIGNGAHKSAQADSEYGLINSVEGLTKNKIGSKRKTEMDAQLSKSRPDMSEEQRKQTIAEIEKLGEKVKAGGDPKTEKLAQHWVLKGNLILPEDEYKLLDAIDVASKKGIDPFSYDNPTKLLMDNSDVKPTLRKTNPDNIKVFSNKKVGKDGLVIYDVEDTKEGQKAVRQVIDEHWGEDANPWCLAARHGEDDTDLSRAWRLWNTYNAQQKRIAFLDGELIGFCATDRGDATQWWDRLDNSNEEGITIKSKSGKKRFEATIDEDGNFVKYTKIYSGDENMRDGYYREYNPSNPKELIRVERRVDGWTVEDHSYMHEGEDYETHCVQNFLKDGTNMVSFRKFRGKRYLFEIQDEDALDYSKITSFDSDGLVSEVRIVPSKRSENPILRYFGVSDNGDPKEVDAIIGDTALIMFANRDYLSISKSNYDTSWSVTFEDGKWRGTCNKSKHAIEGFEPDGHEKDITEEQAMKIIESDWDAKKLYKMSKNGEITRDYDSVMEQAKSDKAFEEKKYPEGSNIEDVSVSKDSNDTIGMVEDEVRNSEQEFAEVTEPIFDIVDGKLPEYDEEKLPLSAKAAGFINHDKELARARNTMKDVMKKHGMIGDAVAGAFDFSKSGYADPAKAKEIGEDMVSKLSDMRSVYNDARKQFLQTECKEALKNNDFSELRKASEPFDVQLADIDRAIEWYKDFAEGKNNKTGDHEGIRYRSGDTFVSNAKSAVEGIKQEKATGEQWLAMIKKNGGLKAEEDKWMGLSDWLAGKKSVTKAELLEFIAENSVEVEEVNYEDRGADSIFNEDDYYMSMLDIEFENLRVDFGAEEAFIKMQERHAGIEEFADINGMYLDWEEAMYRDWDFHDWARKDSASYNVTRGTHPTRLSYTTKGLENKREIALTVPAIEPYNQSDSIHFGDAGEGRAVAWLRFGDAYSYGTSISEREAEYDNYVSSLVDKYGEDARTDPRDTCTPEEVAELNRLYIEIAHPSNEKQKVLVIDEIQSKRHQDGREKGYQFKDPKLKQQLDDILRDYRTAQYLYEQFINSMGDSILFKDRWSEYDKERYEQLKKDYEEANKKREDFLMAHKEFNTAYKNSDLVPDAPFRKNWHELAMKRALRYAAENGYDKIAWTTGAQQADRYNLRSVVDEIEVFQHTDPFTGDIIEGEYSVSTKGKDGDNILAASGIMNKDKMLGIFGKELTEKMTANPSVDGTTFKGNDLEIGGEGMKGFYDKMLPTFMNKYGKKWGVKVGEVELAIPNKADRKMWSVDVTPEMKESVMQGQPMFRTSTSEAGEKSMEAEKARSRAQYLIDSLGGNGDVFVSSEDVKRDPVARKALHDNHSAMAWYDPKTGKVGIYLPNVKSMYELERTVFHEKIGHEGLRGLLGEEGYKQFYNAVWMSLSPEMRSVISARAQRNGWDYHAAMDEVLAEKAEDFGEYGDAEGKKQNTWMQMAKNAINTVLHKLGFKTTMTEDDVRVAMWLSKNRLSGNTNNIAYKLSRAAFTSKVKRHSAKADVSADGYKWADSESKMAAKTHEGKILEENIKEGGAIPTEAEGVFEYKPSGEIRMRSMTKEEKEEQMRHLTLSGVHARKLYEDKLKRIGYLWTEAHQNNMLSLEILQNAISGGKDKVKDSENVVFALNELGSRDQQEQERYERTFVNPLTEAVRGIIDKFDGSTHDERRKEIDKYLNTKHGIERNRVLAVRDYVRGLLKSKVAATKAAGQKFQQDFDAERARLKGELDAGRITFKEYFEQLDTFIGKTINDFEPSKNDMSGLSDNKVFSWGDGNRGYDEEKAIDYVMDMEAKMGKDGTEALWNSINAISKFTVEKDYNCGYIGKAAKDRMDGMFDWYVPLRGFDETTAEDEWKYINGETSYVGMSAIKTRGRGSAADAPLSTLVAMGDASILRGNRNVAKQSLVRLARNHENDLLTEIEVDYLRSVDPLTGETMLEPIYPDFREEMSADKISNAIDSHNAAIELRKQNGEDIVRLKDMKGHVPYRIVSPKNQNQHIINVKVNGNTVSLMVHSHPRAAQAANGMLTNSTRGLSWVKAANSAMSQLATSRSLTFMARNSIRDFGFASTSILATESLKYNLDFQKAYLSLVGKNAANLTAGMMPGIDNTSTVRQLFKNYRDPKWSPTTKVEKWFKEFADGGGITGYVQMKSVDECKENINKIIKSSFSKGKYVGKNKDGFYANTFGAYFELVEGMNEAIENQTRFAAFIASIKSGRSVKRSVQDAKNISVNFNKTGAGSSTLSMKFGESSGWYKFNRLAAGGSAYAFKNMLWFYNAGIQGMSRVCQMYRDGDAATRTKLTSGFVAVPFVLGSVMSWINAAAASLFDDDDEEKKKYGNNPYLQLPEYERRQNACFYLGGGRFLKIPLAIECRAFFGIGDIAAGVMHPELWGNKNPMPQVFEQLTQLTPIDVMGGSKVGSSDWEGSVLGAVTPSLVQPIIAYGTNIGWTGAKISRESQYNKNDPNWTKGTYKTSEWITDAAHFLNNATGGKDAKDGTGVESGIIDLNPAKMQYLLEQYGSGPGKDMLETINTIMSMTESETPTDLGRVPVLKAVYRDNTPINVRNNDKTRWYSYIEDSERITSEITKYAKHGSTVEASILRNSKEGKIARVVKSHEKLIKKLNKRKNLVKTAADKKAISERIDAEIAKAMESIDAIEASSK